METNFSPVFDFVLKNFGKENVLWILYLVNLILAMIAYKLGFARKLPILKSVFVYITLAFGTLILAFFGGVFRMPITESLLVISFVLGVYRLRLHQERKVKKNK